MGRWLLILVIHEERKPSCSHIVYDSGYVEQHLNSSLKPCRDPYEHSLLVCFGRKKSELRAKKYRFYITWGQVVNAVDSFRRSLEN